MPDMKSRLETISNLFHKAANYLIFVEYGSNAGFTLINEIREYINELAKSHNEECFIFSPVSFQCLTSFTANYNNSFQILVPS